MGLLGGIVDIGKNALDFVTQPLQTGAKMVGTGLETGGKVLGEVAEGDLAGAAGAAVEGGKQQFGNVTGYFGEQVDNVKGVAGGVGEFVQGGVGLVGTPIQTGARLVGNGLETTGGTINELADGDVAGAAGRYGEGVGDAFGIVGDGVRQQWDNLV